MMKRAWIVGLLALAACGGGGGGGGGDGGGADGGGGAVMCTATPPVFPGFDKGCTGASSCVIAFHQISCCGTRRALGINHAAKAAFDAAEATCEAQYPGCGCAQGPTSAEDGKTTTTESTIAVTCTPAGMCSTSIP